MKLDVEIKIPAVEKLYELVFEKAIGGLFAPWQVRRMSKAHVDAKVYEMLTLAKAEKLLLQSDAGIVTWENGKLLPRPASDRENTVLEVKHFQLQMPQNFSRAIGHKVFREELRKEINVSKTLAFTAEELENDNSEAIIKNIDDDWLYRWRDCAANTSSEDMQKLWGRILAGEVKSPGNFSLRTLDFIRNLSSTEADKISKYLALTIDNIGAIFKPENLGEIGDFDLYGFLELETLGLISGASGELRITISSTKTDFSSLVIYHEKIIKICSNELSKVATLRAFPLTPLGKQIRKFLTPEFNEKYYEKIIEEFESQGFDVWLATIKSQLGGNIEHTPFGIRC